MAKVAFSKLGLKVNQEVNTFEWNGQKVEVKQYLPIAEKFTLISEVLMNCQDTDNNNFMSISKMVMYLGIQIVIHYTNINVTDKMKEDPAKLYDQLDSTGLLTEIKNNMDEKEFILICDWCKETCEHLYTYRNSIYAILDAMGTDYANLELDIEELQKSIKDPESLTLLKDTLTKLG